MHKLLMIEYILFSNHFYVNISKGQAFRFFPKFLDELVQFA